ncbi:MACPF domain-containing protein NSL1-like [Abrus precatorius]|uniref:MACPF domain-containing protein NSL1-like n=1 Tax=Abrus precatorius TaxID=3816 RepID=A0A8B8KWR4_ABRPR|nr:MACPF domain-containing protein NSL1-like [Abrus precatorius]
MDMIRNGGYELEPQSAAEKAVSVIGLGYDVCKDIRLGVCKCRVLELDINHTKNLEFPGGVVVPNVPSSVKCHPGERLRLSHILPFDEMSKLFNQKLSLSGNIPSGMFNAMFDLRSCCWKKDATSTKMLGFDGWFITLYEVELDGSHRTIANDVIREVPSSWNPAALAEFIEKYGTHSVVGVKMGGMDVVHIKQLTKSNLEPAEVQKLLKQVADERFSRDLNTSYGGNSEISQMLKNDEEIPWEVHIALAASVNPHVKSLTKNQDIMSISVRRGGYFGIDQNHDKWISTVSQSPNVISMNLVPITSLMNSVPGIGFLNHAINLYLKYKPPIEELHQFLEFQLRRHWAPVYDQPLRFGSNHRRNKSPALQFTFMGPKLYIKTMQVDCGYRPITGLRLFLEGRKSDHLAIHLQHLSNLPSTIKVLDHHNHNCIDELIENRAAYFEPVKWKMFSHICTAPIQCNGSLIDESSCIVTKAWFEVKLIKMKKVLFLRLGYSAVASSKIRKSEWDGPSSASRKSGFFSVMMSTLLSQELHQPGIETEKPPKEDIDSAVATGTYNVESTTDAPVPTKTPKMLRFVDTNEVVRGPNDTPGYWVVTGAKLSVEGGKISIRVKYSLLDIING